MKRRTFLRFLAITPFLPKIPLPKPTPDMQTVRGKVITIRPGLVTFDDVEGWKELRKAKLEEHMVDIERSFFFGVDERYRTPRKYMGMAKLEARRKEQGW